MTFDPVLPPLVLVFAAVAVFALRALALPLAARAGRRSLMRWTVTTVALTLILLAAARPVGGRTDGTDTAARPQTGANVYFVVDRSADSAVPDFAGAARMSGIRDDIETLIDAHPGARFAVIAFASRPAIDWPLSADAWSLQPVVETLTPYPDADSADVNAAAAANTLRYQLISAGQQFPRAPNLVYYLGSGAPEATVPQGVFDTPDIDGGAVLGYGVGGEPQLRVIADQLGLPYAQRTPGEKLPQVDAPVADTATAAAAGPQNRVELYWVLTLLASVLLLVEIFLTTRDLRRARATRRGALP